VLGLECNFFNGSSDFLQKFKSSLRLKPNTGGDFLSVRLFCKLACVPWQETPVSQANAGTLPQQICKSSSHSATSTNYFSDYEISSVRNMFLTTHRHFLGLDLQVKSKEPNLSHDTVPFNILGIERS